MRYTILMSYVALVDCNNFFVSCERLFRPDLKNKPVLVLSSNDGCVVSRSKEVKELGIPMGIPYFKALDDIRKHNVTVFSSNFTLYRDISSRVMNTIASFELPFEQYSVDEAFVLLGDSVPGLEEMERIRTRIEEWTGIPVSIGVGRNAVLAKYASEVAKRSEGISVISPGVDWNERMKQIHVGELWGVGRQTTQKFLDNRIKTAHDITVTDTAVLRSLFGIEGIRLRTALLGESYFEIGQREESQSITSSRSFKETTQSKRVLLDAISYHISHAAEKMRTRGQATLRMSVNIRPRRHGAYALHGGFREVVFDVPTFDTRTLIKEAKVLLDELYEEGVEYGKAGVVLGGFVPLQYTPVSLFEDVHARDDAWTLNVAIDRINKRFGSHALHPGTLLKESPWQTRSLRKSPLYTTDWDSLRVVRCEKKGRKGHVL